MRTFVAAYRIALRRRVALWLKGDFHPFPSEPVDVELSPSLAHARALDAIRPRASYVSSGTGDPGAWQQSARTRLSQLTGYPAMRATPVARHHREHDLPEGLRRRRLYLRLWHGGDAPVDIIWREGTERLPVMICLQGTNSGSHLSWGEARMPPDPEKIAGGGDYARQAVREGYLAVCLEQSCFGERQERHLRPRSASPTIDAANHAFLLGRTLLGERAGDVSSVVDWMHTDGALQDLEGRVNRDRIHVMGSSAGGTAALYAAALDERIGAVLASGSVGFIRDTIARRRDDSAQNVIPGILNWLETDDIAGLIAPRPLLAISGTYDHIFPFCGADAVVQSARAIYRALGAEGAIAAVAAHGPHRFYPEVAWPAFRTLLERLPIASPS